MISFSQDTKGFFESTENLKLCLSGKYPLIPLSLESSIGNEGHTFNTTAGEDLVLERFLSPLKSPSEFIQLFNQSPATY